MSVKVGFYRNGKPTRDHATSYNMNYIGAKKFIEETLADSGIIGIMYEIKEVA